MHKFLFGTDGIRGTFGKSPFEPESLTNLGKAIGCWAVQKYSTPKILIGYDPRISSHLAAAALKFGMLQYPVKIDNAHIIPTPVLHYLVHELKLFDCGIMITASHNPYTDNGIKIIDSSDGKISKDDQNKILQFLSNNNFPPANFNNLGTCKPSNIINKYIEVLENSLPNNFLLNTKVVIDCANGAMSNLAPDTFRFFGANVITINCDPDGKNINKDCGSTHPDAIKFATKQHNADFGIAFDGDGDRLFMVNKNGEVKDGDDILAILSTHPSYENNKNVVGTIISNQGLELWLKQKNKNFIRASVGEKNIIQEINKNNCLVGSEPSGHIIIKEFADCSDGLFVALKTIESALVTNNLLLKTFQRLPQTIINIPAKSKQSLTAEPIANIIKKYQTQIIPGRIVVRYSGTEPLLRVMVESSQPENVMIVARNIKSDLTPLLN